MIRRDFGISQAVRNLSGIQAVYCFLLNVTCLAVGGEQGRFIIWSRSGFVSLAKIGSQVKTSQESFFIIPL